MRTKREKEEEKTYVMINLCNLNSRVYNNRKDVQIFLYFLFFRFSSPHTHTLVTRAPVAQ